MAMTIIDATPSDLKRRLEEKFEGEMEDQHHQQLTDDENVSSGGGGDAVSSSRGKRVVRPSTDASSGVHPSSQSIAESQRSSSSLSKRLHPWGPEAQGLPEVDTVAGDTATMTHSEHPTAASIRRTGGGFRGARSPTPQERRLQHELRERARQQNQQPQSLTDRLRLQDEELDEDFRSAQIRQGIETARKKKLAAMSSWKTPYEVDAPRAIMLPRENPHETSTSSSSVADASSMDPMTVEQKIWKGIEALIADTFSSDDDTTTVATSDILPRALVRAISTRSFISAAASTDLHSVYSSSTTGTRSLGSRSSPLATMSEEDELTMAQAALDTFIDLLVPEAGGRSSVPTLASYSTPSSAGTSSRGSPADYDEIAIAEVALHNFMDVLLQEVETASTSGALSSDGSTAYSAKGKAALQLLDLFQWTLKMNVDGEERLRFLESERERQARRERELEEQIRLHEEQLRMQRDAELQAEINAERELEAREEQLWQEHIRQMEQEEAEKQAAEAADGVDQNVAVEPQSRRSSKRSRRKKSTSKSPPRTGTMDAGAALELRLYDQAERLRVEAEGEPDDFDVYASVRRAELSSGSMAGDVPLNTPVTNRPSLLEMETPITRGDGTGSSLGGGLLMAPAPKNLPPRDISNTIPNFSTEDDSNRKRPPPTSSSSSATPGSSRWATIGGMPIVMAGDEGSLDPTQLPSIHDRAPRGVASSSELSRRNAGSSTASNSDVSAKSMPSLLPSESKRLLFIKDDYTTTSGVSEELSLDPAELPNLAKTRVDRQQREQQDAAGSGSAAAVPSSQGNRKRSPRRHPTESASGKAEEQPTTSGQSQAPQWFGGRAVIMSTASETSDDNSPASHETNLLPNSFYSGENIQATLNESGSTGPGIAKSATMRQPQGGSSGTYDTPPVTAAGIPTAPQALPVGPDVPKPDDELPDLRSISEGSMSTATSGSTGSGTREGSSLSNVFTNSFTEGVLKSSNSSQTSQSASERFFSGNKTSSGMSNVMAATMIVGDGAGTQESSNDPPNSSTASFSMFDSESANFGDFSPVEGRGGTFRSESKTTISTKTPIDHLPAEEMVALEKQQQQILEALAVVAKKKAKLDGKSIPSDKHFRSTSNAHTDVASLGSAGDIHIMGTWVRFSKRDLKEDGTGGELLDDEITLDSHLVRDELRFGNGGRTSVPAVKPNAGRRRSFGSRLRSSINAFRCRGDSWPCRPKNRYPATKRPTVTSTSRKPKLEKKLSSRRCLLYAEEEGYDRTPIGYDDTEITPGGLIGIDEHEYL